MSNSAIPLTNFDGGDDFPIKRNEFQDLIDPKNFSNYEKMGGLEGVRRALKVDLKRGLSDETDEMEVDGERVTVKHAKRKQQYGINRLPDAKITPFWKYFFGALSDKILILLMIAAAVSIAIGIYEEVGDDTHTGPGSYVEGIAILVAVLLVSLVNSINDYRKEQQFRKLNAKKDDREIQVIRDGEQQLISIYELVVGDVLQLNTGDLIPADGVFIDGHNIKCDESGMTGESDAIKKNHHKDPFLLSGTKVLEGVGTMLVVAVGTSSLNGKTLMSLRTEAEDTPLQVKLGDLAETIGKIGLSAAILMLIILIIRYFVDTYAVTPTDPRPTGAEVAKSVVEFLITAVTIVVVAVPEGLPMAVTLALAYATVRMLKDNNLVRHLAACETMGGATTICSDKTGTLTQNKMTVVRGYMLTKSFDSIEGIKGFSKEVSEEGFKVLIEGLALNSTAYETKDDKGKLTFVGSKTETALLGFVAEAGADFSVIRQENTIDKLFPFSSERKRMSSLVKKGNIYRLYCKGASEIVLGFCQRVLLADGSIQPLSHQDRNDIEKKINAFATDALRTIGIAYSEFTEEEYSSWNWEESPETNLIFVGLAGIQDPLRAEVPHALEQCRRAGIKVRMVTGDNAITAKNIAKNCGILTKGGIVMEGSEFRRLTIDQMDRIVPGLQVLARSSPMDKQLLVERLKARNETVAVTGDGTNDAPALKLADVGFAMNIAGTEVAKEASDIILMDDNFASIVKAVIWGRSVYDSVRKFLQFQLTVNITAVTLAFISAIASSGGHSVLTAVQLLWVNLIMDTFAALALATEPPTEKLLNRKPHGKNSPLISIPMWKMIIGQAIFQVAVNLVLLYLAADILGIPDDSPRDQEKVVRTVVFNTFVFMQIFNEFNARKIDDSLNIFDRIHKHYSFLIIFFITVVIQFIVCQYGGPAFKTVGLNWKEWIFCVGISAVSLPIGLVIRLIPVCCHLEHEEFTPEPVSREKLLWENAIADVRTQIRVVDALRRHREVHY